MNGPADRRREEKERRREEILAAALQVAAGIGLEAMTMDQVAQRARLSRALLYVYFADRDDLLVALCEKALKDLATRFHAAIAAGPTGRERLVLMGRAYIAFAREQPVLFDALARFEARPGAGEPGENLAACIACSDQVHQLMIDAIRAGIADGSVRASLTDLHAVATVLWGFIHGVLQITATKGALLQLRGLEAEGLLSQALDLAQLALAPPGEERG